MELLYVMGLTVVALAVLGVVGAFRRRLERLVAEEELPPLLALADRSGRVLVTLSEPGTRLPFVVMDLRGYRVRVMGSGRVARGRSRVASVTVIHPHAGIEPPRVYLRTAGWADQAALPSLAAASVRVALRKLDEMFARPGVRVVVTSGAVCVYKRCRLTDDGSLETLVDAVIRLVDAARGCVEEPVDGSSPTKGVEILPPDEEASGEVACATYACPGELERRLRRASRPSTRG